MADNEVKIHVNTEADTKGIEDAESRLRKLKEEEAKTTTRPPGQPAATPQPAPRAEPRPAPERQGPRGKSELATEANPRTPEEKPQRRWETLRPLTEEERAQNRLKNEQAEQERAQTIAAKERAAEEKKINKEKADAERLATREVREQEAMRKAGVGRIGGAISAGQGILSGGDSAQSASSTMLSAGMQSGSPHVMIAAAIGAALVGVAGLVAREMDKDTSQGLGIGERAANRGYQQGRQAGIFGSSGGLVSDALSADEDIEQRKNARSSIAEKARQKWYAPSTWEWFGMRKNEGTREQEVNEAEIENREKEKAEATKKAQAKYMSEEGGLRMESLRGRSQRSLAGSRSAFVADMGQEWLAKYKEELAASGSEDIAKEMADLTVSNKVRDRQASAGAGLVDAKSGGAEMAAAARWGMQSFPDMRPQIDALHATVKSQANPLEKQSK